jgi:hypothetical protein
VERKERQREVVLESEIENLPIPMEFCILVDYTVIIINYKSNMQIMKKFKIYKSYCIPKILSCNKHIHDRQKIKLHDLK